MVENGVDKVVKSGAGVMKTPNGYAVRIWMGGRLRYFSGFRDYSHAKVTFDAYCGAGMEKAVDASSRDQMSPQVFWFMEKCLPTLQAKSGVSVDDAMMKLHTRISKTRDIRRKWTSIAGSRKHDRLRGGRLIEGRCTCGVVGSNGQCTQCASKRISRQAIIGVLPNDSNTGHSNVETLVEKGVAEVGDRDDCRGESERGVKRQRV